MTIHEIGFTLGGLFAFVGISILLMTAGEVGSVFGGLLALTGIGLMLSYGFRKVMGTCFLFAEAYFPIIVILLVTCFVIAIVIIDAAIELL